MSLGLPASPPPLVPFRPGHADWRGTPDPLPAGWPSRMPPSPDDLPRDRGAPWRLPPPVRQ